MSQQLVKKGTNGKYSNVMPKSWTEAIKDKSTGINLEHIIQSFNMYFLSYNGNTSTTRCLVPPKFRRKGLWITYIKYDGNVYIEWYNSDKIDDESWGDSSNWRIGNNTLVGDITISSNGNWVINGTETEFKAVGEKGNTPLLRVANNRLQVSYDLGDTYIDVTSNPVYTKFRWYSTTEDTHNVGRIQASTDEGKTWTNMSNDFTNNLHIKKYIGVNESLPTSGIAEGTIYAKGPYYAEDDTLNDNPIYRLWVYAWKGNTLAWVDNGEFQSIAAGVVQETGDSETKVMSQKAVTTGLSELGQYVENNPEYLRVYTDANGKILWGIKKTGEVFFGYGVPSQVIGYVENVIPDIGIESLLEGKVDKVDGKSLIDVYFAEGVRYSQNKEWVKTLVDNEGKLLLAIGKDGNLFFGYGIPKQIIDYINKNISSIGINDLENRFQIIQDSDGNIVAFRDSEGKLNELVGIVTPYLKVKKLDAENVDFFRDITNLSEDDTIYCEKPKYGELWLEGNLPTDKSDARTPTNFKMTFKVSGITQFIGRCNLSIQGHGSTAYDKLGYTFEPVNANGEAINIKFGDMVATDSFHMKAYATDVVRCRDLGGYAIWRDMVKRLSYPANKFNNIPFELPTEYSKNKINIADANYVPLGFQTGVYLNGEFLGLYTIKHKKTRQNYAMDKNVKSQIFLDSINYKSWLKEGFDHTAWDLKNPKIKGYEEGDEISDAEVKGNIERLFNYLYQINPNDSSTYSNYQEYIVLPHWIAFLILIELVHGIDQVGNNINLMTWDATRWSIVPWDLDLSCGLVGGSKIIRSDESYYQQFSLRTQNTSTPNEMKFWPDFKKIFATEIKETWTMLRKSGFISEANIADYYKKEIDGIPRSVYEADFEKWGNIWTNGIPTFEQLMLAIHYKIKWLDTQWLNNN